MYVFRSILIKAIIICIICFGFGHCGLGDSGPDTNTGLYSEPFSDDDFDGDGIPNNEDRGPNDDDPSCAEDADCDDNGIVDSGDEWWASRHPEVYLLKLMTLVSMQTIWSATSDEYNDETDPTNVTCTVSEGVFDPGVDMYSSPTLEVRYHASCESDSMEGQFEVKMEDMLIYWATDSIVKVKFKNAIAIIKEIYANRSVEAVGHVVADIPDGEGGTKHIDKQLSIPIADNLEDSFAFDADFEYDAKVLMFEVKSMTLHNEDDVVYLPRCFKPDGEFELSLDTPSLLYEHKYKFYPNGGC